MLACFVHLISLENVQYPRQSSMIKRSISIDHSSVEIGEWLIEDVSNDQILHEDSDLIYERIFLFRQNEHLFFSIIYRSKNISMILKTTFYITVDE
jgi:hypothetical protein